MENWQAWVAALGGLVALGQWPLGAGAATPWYAIIGGLTAIVFGVWAVYAE